jgi:hypothetical protein
MCGGNLGAAKAIDQLQPTDGTTLVIGPQDNAAEYAVSDDSRREMVYALARLLELERRLLFLKARKQRRVADARQQRITLIQANGNDAIEVIRCQRTNSSLGATRDSSLFIQQATFDQAVYAAEGNRIDEIEIAPMSARYMPGALGSGMTRSTFASAK